MSRRCAAPSGSPSNEAARLAAGPDGAILVLDEVQKAVGWSESVKRLWDEDTRARRPLKVVAGRLEVLRLPHWSLAEMRAAFDFSVDQYLYFGAIRAPRHSRASPTAGGATSSTRWWRRRLPATSCCSPGGAGLLTGLAKFSGRAVRQRGSSPKLQVLNTALMSAQSGLSFEEARADRATGAHLANAAAAGPSRTRSSQRRYAGYRISRA